ncbi:MAG: GTPase HflX [Cyanobacteriota bacterium]|nr:GTPase HflX [Cyanobacteriota bacterium]
MKQTLLGGRTTGLRPAQRRRLERLSHRRHVGDGLADALTLQRLGDEALELERPVTLLVDGRGLCRLLWLGPLQRSAALREKLPGWGGRQGGPLTLLTCTGPAGGLDPDAGEAVVALDLGAALWLRFAPKREHGGRWPARLLGADGGQAMGWRQHDEGDLERLCATPGGSTTADSATPAPALIPKGGDGRERVLLLMLDEGDRMDCQSRRLELEGLVRSAGSLPVGVIEQRRAVSPQTIWGEGKLRETALEARRLEASLVVTDRELTPAQGRNLERLLDLPVSDRSEVILDIFAQRAGSAAGRLQVELAQLRYRLPRLLGRGQSLSRQGGGIGTRGPGETQLEQDRRAISRRIETLQRQVRDLGAHRARLRMRRSGETRLALVGYTNAGKSSLLNALTRAGDGQAVLAENTLFATLDPTTRRVQLPDPDGGPPRRLLLTDTVGFIRDLPPQLLEAFRSTLEEALDADALLLVVDLADPGWHQHLETVHRLLDQLGAEAPRQVIGNQIDRCPAVELERARQLVPDLLFVAATAGLGLQHLRLKLWPLTRPCATIKG